MKVENLQILQLHVKSATRMLKLVQLSFPTRQWSKHTSTGFGVDKTLNGLCKVINLQPQLIYKIWISITEFLSYKLKR